MLTFTPSLSDEAVSSWTQALIANLQVVADMRTAAVVVEALVGACRGEKVIYFPEDIIAAFGGHN